MFVGFGKDIHRLEKKNKKILLGGIEIQSEYSIISHSDGDILFHAISRSILGALSLEDIGIYFPNDKKNINLNSYEILNFSINKMKESNLNISNIDITITCEKIILKDFLLKIKEKLIKDLNCKNISLKATKFEDKNNDFILCEVILILT
jgi:2-C-methyl-D-erythritol 2,4-cyclodiphosphate synthase